MRIQHIESICVFGSVARSNTDALSDKDVLVVATEPSRRRELAHEWRARGWSVSLYSPSRFRAMVGSGSLFAQHLKHEALILRDSYGWLKGTLNSAQPKASYWNDARKSVQLAKPIERFPGDLRIRENLIVADLAYVSVRNFGINYLANRGRLLFDYDQVVTEIARELSLRVGEVNLLRSLRSAKSAYRTGLPAPSIDDSVGELRSVLTKLFPNSPLQQISAHAPPRKLGSGYTTLRDHEALIVSTLGHVPSSEEQRRLGLAEVWRWVCSPQDYSWNVRNFENLSAIGSKSFALPAACLAEDWEARARRTTRAIATGFIDLPKHTKIGR